MMGIQSFTPCTILLDFPLCIYLAYLYSPKFTFNIIKASQVKFSFL